MSSPIPLKIAKALIAIQKSIDVFFNDSRNNHQSFNYVSIDAYYQQIRPLLNEHNLIFLVNEVEANATENMQVVKIQYHLSILHVDGVIWDTGLNRNIYVKYRNETSCGSALSYAEKNFFRTIFKIPTGEKMQNEPPMIADSDPDGHDQENKIKNAKEIAIQEQNKKRKSETSNVKKNW
tara:strand:- start:5324 stop:5860 length:537 start_codon:yes stop_codon:yes gene_type:complete